MLAIIIYVGLFAWGMASVPFRRWRILGVMIIALA